MKKKSSVKFISISKVALIIMLFNIFPFYAIVGSYIPYCTNVCIIVAIGAVLIDLSGKRFNVYKGMGSLFIYAIYILISGFILTLFNNYNITKIIAYYEFLVLMAIVYYIVYQDENSEFFYWLGILLALSVALVIMSTGNFSLSNFNLNVRVSLSEATSENSVGLIIIFGVFGSIFTKKRVNPVIILLINFFFLIIIVLTASRQALLFCLLLYIGKFLLVNHNMSERKNWKWRVGIIIGIAVIIIFTIRNYDILINTKLYLRLTGQNVATEISDRNRIYLYQQAFKLYLDNVFLGVGYNNVRELFAYTHSTYMEILAGTGTIGFIILFAPTFAAFISTIKCFIQSKKYEMKLMYAERIILFTLLLVIGLFRSLFYYHISCIMVAILCAELQISKELAS